MRILGLTRIPALCHAPWFISVFRMIARNPLYKVLLFPYRAGEKQPLTSWNPDRTVLTVDLRDGTVDTITFTDGKDQRTRLAFHRSGS